MIHVKRTPEPSALKSSLVEAARLDAKKTFKKPLKDRKQKQYKFLALTSKLPELGPVLHEMFLGKCAFCESYVHLTDPSYMDRYRPKSGALNMDGIQSPDHYWWLAYEWSNLYLVCLPCNKIRGERFPISASKRALPGVTGDALLKEKPLLLDPCRDCPDEDLVFDETGLVASETERGRATIECLGLNRIPLVRARSEVVASLRAKWQTLTANGSKAAPTDFVELAEQRLSFLALRRQCLRQWSTDLETNRGFKKHQQALITFLDQVPRPMGGSSIKREKAAVDKTVESFKKYQASQDTYSVEQDAHKSKYYSRARFIERLEIKNFRGIQHLLLDFPAELHEQGSWLLMLGENGTGKTSVLTALALALMGEDHRQKFLQKHKMKASEFVRFGCDSGYIKVHLTNSPEPIVLNFRRSDSQFQTNSVNPMVLLLGYGATRLLPHDGMEPAKAVNSTPKGHASKADNLFNPFVPLNDAQEWLASLPKSDFDFIARGLRELLLLEKEDLIKDPKDKRKIVIKGYRSRVPLEEMSAGFQSVVALTADVMSVLRLRWKTMDAAEGIVLVDELDAHLHPRWKMEIVSRLRAAFPRLQFIVSSHDPLCLRGLQAGEVVVMKRDAKGRPIVITDLPAPDTLRVEQILTSEFFGLNSTVEPKIDRAFNQYYHLLALRNPTAKQLAEIEKLKAELRVSDQLGTTRRERVMLEAVDKFLAEHDQIANTQRRTDLKQETQNKIAELWKTVEPAGKGVL